jgi:hypothetical protein
MLNIDLSDTFGLGTHTVKRLGPAPEYSAHPKTPMLRAPCCARPSKAA